MPAKAAILYPSIVMALFTLTLIASLGLRRFYAVRARKMDPRFYKTFDTPTQEPEGLRKHTRNVQNHFEVPPLFHLAVWGTYAAGEVTTSAVVAAWLFVAARAVHTYVHVTHNTVLQRFAIYGVALFACVYLWLHLALTIA